MKMCIKLEVYYSSKIDDYTTSNFYLHQYFSHHRWPFSGTELSLLARWHGELTVPHVT